MKISVNTPLKCSRDQAWHILAEGFGSIGTWSCSIAESSLEGELGVGATRTCVSAESFGPFKAGVVKETLTEFDEQAKIFTYQAVSGLPKFIARASNRWSFFEKGDRQSSVRFDAEITFSPWVGWLEPILRPLMIKMMQSDLSSFQEEMQYRLAHGKPHPRKGI